MQVGQNSASGQAQNGESGRPQESVSAFIAFRPVTKLMRSTIDLDRKAALQADKIENDPAEWVLATKFEAARSFTKLPPHQDFRQVA